MTAWGVSRWAQSLPTSSASALRKALLSVPAAPGDLTDSKAAVGGFFPQWSRLVFSARRAPALTPEQDLRLGTTWGTRWRSSYHAAGFGEALGGPGCTPCGQTGRAGPLGLRYPGSSCWGLLAPLKGENRWHEGRLLLEPASEGGSPLLPPGTSPGMNLVQHMGMACQLLRQKTLAKQDMVVAHGESGGGRRH